MVVADRDTLGATIKKKMNIIYEGGEIAKIILL